MTNVLLRLQDRKDLKLAMKDAKKQMKAAREAITTYQDYDLSQDGDIKILSCINRFGNVVNKNISADKLGESGERVDCEFFDEHEGCKYELCPCQSKQIQYVVALEQFERTDRWLKNYDRTFLKHKR